MSRNPSLYISFFVMLLGTFLIAWWSVNTDLAERVSITLIQILAIPFQVAAIVEVNSSETIDKKQKTMWTFGFILAAILTGIIYLVSERRKLLSA